jgi:hypothetical protein
MHLCIVFDEILLPIHFKNQIFSTVIMYGLLEEKCLNKVEENFKKTLGYE